MRFVLSARYVIVLTGFIVGAVGALSHSAYRAASLHAEAQLERIVAVEATLLREFGYDGLIHNFKNYVLRGSPNYRAAAINNVFRLRTSLITLRELVPEDHHDDIKALRQTIDAYRVKLDVAEAAIERGAEPSTIDALVQIDDLPATRALEKLLSEMRETLTARQAMLARDLRVFVRGLIFLIMTVVALVAALIVETARLHRAQARADHAAA